MDKIRNKELEHIFLQSVANYTVNESPRFPLSPSSATKPLRDLYYGLHNYFEPGHYPVDPLEPRVKLIFESGHLHEELVKNHFRRAVPIFAEQHRVEFGSVSRENQVYILGGSIDWATNIDGDMIIMDCKTANLGTFSRAPKEDNIAQMQLYMHSSWARSNNVNKAILVYFHKDSSEIKCFEVHYNPDEAAKWLNRFYLAWEYYLKKEVPPREYILGKDWQARYTTYKTADNMEFLASPECRPYHKSDKESPDIREHVLTYGNSVVAYVDGTYWAVWNKRSDRLDLVNKETSQWEEVS